MVQRARELGLYDALVVNDLLTWLARDAQASAFDAIVAADVLVYFGDLRPPLGAVQRLRVDGAQALPRHSHESQVARGNIGRLPVGRKIGLVPHLIGREGDGFEVRMTLPERPAGTVSGGDPADEPGPQRALRPRARAVEAR